MAADTLRLENIYALSLEPREKVPLMRGWKRLEGRPSIPDFERSLRAEVRDPLWFLTRQWQFGEFQGEDAASPIDVALGLRSTPLVELRIGSVDAPYDPAVPIETRVEREPSPFDLTIHMQGSRYLARLLRLRKIPAFLAKFVAEWKISIASIAGEPGEDAGRLQAAGAAFLVDIAQLLDSIRGGKYAAIVRAMTGNAGEQALLISAGTDLLNWFDRTYGAPRTEPSAWRPDRLSYQFACRTAASPDAVSLVADEYRGGTLDWYAFDATGAAAADGPPPASTTLSFLPAGIEFAGMPSVRFWEMENSRTEFGHIDANTNDFAKLLLAEFVLLFSNDWCVVPLELPIGTFARVDGLLVTDVFGEQTWVRAANRGGGADWHNWSMYLLSGDSAESPGLFLAPALTTTLEPPPIEQVQFIRDEMANMVWAIEQRVASSLGEGVVLQSRETAGVATSAPAPETRYLLGTSVPDYWRPFIPVHVPGSVRSIRLQRARLPGPIREPKAEVLRVQGDYFIEEEEVPRAGRIVQRIYQRARWHDGKTFLWVGRRSQTGRGEGSSGLVFDHILERGERSVG
jgi:hypothetical protein